MKRLCDQGLSIKYIHTAVFQRIIVSLILYALPAWDVSCLKNYFLAE